VLVFEPRLLLLTFAFCLLALAAMAYATVTYIVSMKRIREYESLVVEVAYLRDQNRTLGQLDGELRELLDYQEQVLALAGIRMGLAAGEEGDPPSWGGEGETSRILLLRWPVEGDVITPFKETHPGVDIETGRRRAVTAAADGVVVSTERDPELGPRLVVVHSDTLQTVYANNELILAAVGDTVEAGQAIALVGSGFEGEVPHLHFEVLEKGRPVNPQEVIADTFAH
jgi:murein DD-endopeptidase MepM/ murein hydrolase activator NlpD